MQEESNQENQKTIVSFIVGLLIGGLLVWAFSGPSNSNSPAEMDEDMDTEEVLDESDEDVTSDNDEPMMSVGSGDISVENQPASQTIAIDSAEYPVAEGWIGVREFTGGELSTTIPPPIHRSAS